MPALGRSTTCGARPCEQWPVTEPARTWSNSWAPVGRVPRTPHWSAGDLSIVFVDDPVAVCNLDFVLTTLMIQ
jgi:hypothetical protein